MERNTLNIKIENVKKLIRRNAKHSLEKFLDKLHPADIALIVRGLPDIDRKKIWAYFTDKHKIAEVILEMEDAAMLKIFSELEQEVVASLFAEMESDDASYILRLLPLEERLKCMDYIPKDVLEDVEELLYYPEGSAGAIMDTSYFALHEDMTVKEATKQLHKAEDLEMVFYLYVIDDDGRLAGVLSLRQLILNPPERKLSEVMVSDVITVSVMDTENTAADLVDKYSLLALPVIDENRKLAGIITVEDVIDVIREKASDDIYSMVGVSQDERMYNNPIKIARARLPWLVITFIGELIAGGVISYFQGNIEDFLLLAAFMPIVMAMGGNIGSQAATVIIRGAAMGTVDMSHIGRIVSREMTVGVIMGVIIGVMLGVVAPFWGGDAQLGVIVGVAIFFAMIFASFTGAAVPMVLLKLKQDPAVASTPFITALNDITGLAIYFSVAMFLMYHL